ncbi:MAG: glutamate--tRNA ligase [Candidatus Bathyarchaeia archaeon]
MENQELKDFIEKFALLNAIKHNGKAEFKSVLGKVLSEKPALKPLIKELTILINSVINEVNNLPLETQIKRIEEKWPNLFLKEKIKEEKRLPPLPNVEKYSTIVTRFSPNPDCVLHLGSLRAIILSHEYARMYKGKFILRFEDTDPRLKRSSLKFYDDIKEDLLWLNCEWDEEYIQSDRIPIYYEYAEKLIELGGGYVCTCPKEDFLKRISASEACVCRGLPIEKHLERWYKMLDGTFKEGEAVVRVKTELTHPNPAVRDWPALRIIDPEKHPHPRVGKKYRVWPLYNFACGLDDHLMSITHIIRGKEHYTNMIRQKYLYNYFGWSYPDAIHYGRLKIVGAELSKSKIIEKVSNKDVEGYDDPRLATLKALKRRGITPECLRKLVLDIGPKPVDVTLSWENIYAINRKIIDPICNRYFCVLNPTRIIINEIKENLIAKIPLHPNYPERGEKTIEIKPVNSTIELLISRTDLPIFQKNKIVRLMELFNIEIEFINEAGVTARFYSKSYEEARKLKAPLIHWVSPLENLNIEVVMPTAEKIYGKAETALSKEKIGNIVQLVRFGFARIDEKLENKIILYYTHE